MNFSTQISLGDLIMIGGLVIGVVANYFGIVRRIDGLDGRQSAAETQIDDLRRGRGLILGETSDWPDTVRRCFGFHSGNGATRP